eukprot:768157-Hanusia_phi.AAC.2
MSFTRQQPASICLVRFELRDGSSSTNFLVKSKNPSGSEYRDSCSCATRGDPSLVDPIILDRCRLAGSSPELRLLKCAAHLLRELPPAIPLRLIASLHPLLKPAVSRVVALLAFPRKGGQTCSLYLRLRLQGFSWLDETSPPLTCRPPLARLETFESFSFSLPVARRPSELSGRRIRRLSRILSCRHFSLR